MKILSIAKKLPHDILDITSIDESELSTLSNIDTYDYIIINGGDGTIRRVIKTLQNMPNHAKFILNPTGSFNVIAKLNKVPKLEKILEKLEKNQTPTVRSQSYYTLNDEIFLFSAGNMGDLHHIFLSETFRFGLLKKGIYKYALSLLFLLPLHLVITPFMLVSKKKFFIFLPMPYIKKFGSFYAQVNELSIDLENSYNHIELDGDIVTIKEPILDIKYAGFIEICQ